MANQPNDDEAIPVSGIKPLYIGIGAGVIGLIVCIGLFIKMKPKEVENAGPELAPVSTQGMTQKEMQEHLKLTRKGLANLPPDKKPAAEKKEPEKTAARSGGGAPRKSGGGSAPPPKPKKAPKKALDALDGIGDDITGKLK